MKKHMKFLEQYNNSDSSFISNEKKKELVEKHLTQENIKDIPELYNILMDEYREKYIHKMEDKIEYIYKTFQEKYSRYGILESKDSDILFYDLLNIIFNNLNIKLDLEIVFNDENYVDLVFQEFQLKNEL
tara:strand:- start:440 stop:829 length:390 start_codon:yes stop_codon:yes gene_type:complete